MTEEVSMSDNAMDTQKKRSEIKNIRLIIHKNKKIEFQEMNLNKF